MLDICSDVIVLYHIDKHRMDLATKYLRLRNGETALDSRSDHCTVEDLTVRYMTAAGQLVESHTTVM